MKIITPKDTVSISSKKVLQILHDPEASAKAVKLIYVHDCDPGITRIKKGKSFTYKLNGKPVNDEDTLFRIKRLVIPPAWEKVWICAHENGHIQCTGFDVKGRKQYRYHELWNALRNETKFYRLLEFGEALDGIRSRLSKDLAQQNLTKEKVLAAIVSVMDKTSIRVGSSMYEKLYGSYGLSTMKDQHVKINGNMVSFAFKGKKGVYHNISLKSAKLARIIKQCRDIPGKELFQYVDKDGNRHSIDSGAVNNYIKEISGGEFTSKDFRTWTGTTQCLAAFSKIGTYETQTQMKKNVVSALDCVAEALGNTRTVCKKHYVHPVILNSYENNKLTKYLKDLEAEKPETPAVQEKSEKVLLEILKKELV